MRGHAGVSKAREFTRRAGQSSAFEDADESGRVHYGHCLRVGRAGAHPDSSHPPALLALLRRATPICVRLERGEPPERNVRTHAGLVGSLERRRREKILPLPAAGDSSARRRRRKILSVKRQIYGFAVPLRRCDGRLPRSILRFLDRARWNFTYMMPPGANSRTRARAALLQSCRWYNIYVPHIYNICQLIVGSRDTFLFRVLEVGWFPGGVGRGIIA